MGKTLLFTLLKKKKKDSKLAYVRTRFYPHPKRFGQWPNELKIINLLENWLVIEHSMS